MVHCLTIVLSILFEYTTSNYPVGILLKLFWERNWFKLFRLSQYVKVLFSFFISIPSETNKSKKWI